MAYQMMSGTNKDSAENLLIGPGIVTHGFNLAVFDPDDRATWGTMLGATKGGNTANLDMEWYDTQPDGALGKVKGMRWLTKAESKLTTNLLEASKANLLMKLNVFKSTSHSERYDKLEHDGSVAPVQTRNVALFAALVGSKDPIVIVIENAQPSDPVEVNAGTGQENAVFKTEFEGMFEPGNITKIPFYILYPKGGSPLDAPTISPAAGTFTEDQTVTIAASLSADVYYTLDGSYPSANNGFLYSNPLTISKTTALRVVAVEGYQTSAVVDYTYTINKA